MTAPDLAVVVITETEFEAQTKAAVLRDNGIDAVVTNNAPSWTGQVAISSSAVGSSVLVRAPDLDRAREILDRAIADSVDLDWDEVDVGKREDDLPLHRVRRMPLLAKIAFALAAVILLGSTLLGLLALAL